MDWEILVSGNVVPDLVNVAVAGVTAVACLITASVYSWWFWRMQRRDPRVQARWIIFWITVVKVGLMLWAATGVVQNVGFDVGQPLLTLPWRLMIMVGVCGHASLAFLIRPMGPRVVESFVGGGPRVLIVEDEDLLARVYRRLLEAAGFSCAVVGEAGAALESIALGYPDLVIVDYVLPGPNGDETTDLLRGAGYTGPVVSISGSIDVGNGRYVRVLQKPIRLDDLVETVREITEK